MSDTDKEEKEKPASDPDASNSEAGKRAASNAKRHKTSRSSAKAKGRKKGTEGDEKESDQISSATAPAARSSAMRFGPAPKAVVSARHLDSPRERPARGFSLGELSSSGVSRGVAAHEMVMVDMRRRSVVDQNVEALKAWLKAAEQESAS
jgi:ribosomal protein L13E